MLIALLLATLVALAILVPAVSAQGGAPLGITPTPTFTITPSPTFTITPSPTFTITPTPISAGPGPVIPEPTTLTLLGLGLAGLAGAAFKRKNDSDAPAE